MTLDLGVLLERREHHDERHALLVHRSPEIFDRRVQGALRRDEKLIIALNRRVDVVRIDVRVVDVFIALDESDPGVLDCEHTETDQTELTRKKI